MSLTLRLTSPSRIIRLPPIANFLGLCEELDVLTLLNDGRIGRACLAPGVHTKTYELSGSKVSYPGLEVSEPRVAPQSVSGRLIKPSI